MGNKYRIFLFCLSVLTACDRFDMPSIRINSDNLPEGEIKNFIMKTFPSIEEPQVLINKIETGLKGDHSPENIKRTLTNMGMTCSQEPAVCQYNGYVTTVAYGLSSGSGRAKHIYSLKISINHGIGSLQIKKEIQ